MSIPVSIQDKLFTSNTLVSKAFLIYYFAIIWGSTLPILLEIYLFWKLVEKNLLVLISLLPIQIYIGYVILVLFSVLIAKIFLIIVNIIHKPKEGVFKRNKKDRDYYYWSLRAVIKKWPIWISKIIPLPKINKLNFRWFENDSEFIEYGKNVFIGKGASIRASMIFNEYLIIKKVIIDENAIIGANSFISPGTQIGKNSIVGTMSFTRFNQKLKANSIYYSDPLEQLNLSTKNLNDFAKKLGECFSKYFNPFNNKNGMCLNQKKSLKNKFDVNLKYDLFIFGTIYFASNAIPTFTFLYFAMEFFIPYFLYCPDFFSLFINVVPLIIFLLTPLIFIIVYVINLLCVILIGKIFYKIIQIKNPIKEGTFFWETKNKYYKNYFRHSFLLRYIKWKIQKSPFPWLINFAFNFIGNCVVGKDTIIEDSFIAKELLKIGNNTYIGKTLTANHLWDKNLTIKKVCIGSNVVISDLCCVSPGALIKDNTSLLPLSLIRKSEILSPDSVFFDSKIKKLSKKEILNNLNINTLKLNKSETKVD
ncbi:MAG: hypothetical protein ACFFEY_01900 [Candidatus Thorarchaeota archaeon]